MRNVAINMNNIPRRHHWVPQFYLEYFAVPDSIGTKSPEIWCFQRSGTDKPEFKTGIRAVAAKNDLYSKIFGDSKDTTLESEFSEVEGLMSQIWETLAYGNFDFSKSDAYKKGFSLFLGLMLVRHPIQFSDWEKLHKRIVNILDEVKKESDKVTLEISGTELELDFKEYDSYRNQNSTELKNSFLDSAKENIMRLAEQLLKKRWSIVHCDKPSLITSDSPILILNDKNKGINRPDTKIIFPISPYRAFIIDDLIDKPHWQYYPISESNAHELNYLQWVSSDIKFMFSPRSIPDVLTEILKVVDRNSV
ncbi:DUF4238 domain-containing protein [Leptospira saintgironsiae]|uniref:DUF4238 domain-containing protein n=1 Tax=Leptospira saintgironsiae TaxID=2023183 RepID=A0A2M9Y7H2_9LEPT|nr:DUF4238 domain-containing protein [Leptospira saintgironsiae]PJZ47525.1 hypothetical protein CH362_18680 [Leptospira saintgironsiae]